MRGSPDPAHGATGGVSARRSPGAGATRLAGLGRRGLVVGQSGRVPFDEPYGPPPETIELEINLSREQLVAEPREKALEMAREFIYERPFDRKALDDVRSMKHQIDQKAKAQAPSPSPNA